MNVGTISRYMVVGSIAAASAACSSEDQSDNMVETPGTPTDTSGTGTVSPSTVGPMSTVPGNTSTNVAPVNPGNTAPVDPTEPVDPGVAPSVDPGTSTTPVNSVNPVTPQPSESVDPTPTEPTSSEPDNTTEPDPVPSNVDPDPTGPGSDCTITVSSSAISENIGTVGIVEWSTDLAGMTEAWIEFGKDTDYGLRAPVDTDEPNLRTLLLGMVGSSTYNYRIVAKAGDQECTGENQTIETGPVPNSLLNLNVETSGTVAKGFLVTSNYARGGYAYILNEEGSPVWFYSAVDEPTRARMSYDGKHMWISKANVPNNSAQVVRVAMDGSNEENLSADFANMNHDFAITPDESVIFIAYGQGGAQCDDVRERTADGQVRTIVNAGDAYGGSGACHLNAIHYSAEDDTVVFSDLSHDAYVKVRRDTGETVWVLGGGGQNDFTGDGASWDNQHGFHLLGLDRILIFNNGGQGSPSLAIEIALDLDNFTATREWEYSSGLSNNIMGDAQRLDNGNSLVTYSVLGVIQEVDPEKNVVQEITSSGAGAAFGYAEKRETLYGPSPR